MRIAWLLGFGLLFSNYEAAQAGDDAGHTHHDHPLIDFQIRSVRDGNWSDKQTWDPPVVPGDGDRVLVSRGTRVTYDVDSPSVIRLLQVVGTLAFSRDVDTALNVCVLKVQNSDACSEDGFACDFEGVNAAGEPQRGPDGQLPTLEVGTVEDPIPAGRTARIRLHHMEGLDPNDAPALVCCSARMEIHGAPLSRTWVKLAADAAEGATQVELAEPVTGWRAGDEIIITGSVRRERGSFRNNSDAVTTEERRIARIDGTTLHFDRPLVYEHEGSGEFRCEVANLSRNVIVESADPDGVRGHTLYHQFSQGSLSYARFAHLGKEGVLGRYAIHFHLCGDSMRGSSLQGLAIVDSHNRWVTIHGTEYLVVRDCVGYQSVGHGFFLEDGTEVDNLLDRNLGVQAYRGKRLPEQVLSFDPNDGAAFWWANGRNTLTRNVSCENDEYGFRYDLQERSNFDPRLPVRMPDGSMQTVDVRTIPVTNFSGNEAHTEGVYGLLIAANGNDQPDTPIDDDDMLRRIREIDWTGPDARHPHVIRDFKTWQVHYAVRPHSPNMLLENVRIDRAVYGIYRPAFENQVYRGLHMSRTSSEPFNRGMDDASAQTGTITVDGLTFEDFSQYGLALIQLSDNNLSGDAASHFRNVTLTDCRRPLVDRGGGALADPVTEHGVPVYLHDWFGPGRTAKVIAANAPDRDADGRDYGPLADVTGEASVACEVADVEFPDLLQPVDDLPPATVILSVRRDGDTILVRGVSHDNGEIASVTVNGQPATVVSQEYGVADWEVRLHPGDVGAITAFATDAAGNPEHLAHQWRRQ
jgi:hypothetical protein